MTLLDRLNALRKHGGPARTTGLPDDVILDFAARDPKLPEAVEAAWEAFEELRSEEPELLELDEVGQAQAIQEGYVNFYADDAVNPYVALAARGPWLVTLKGISTDERVNRYGTRSDFRQSAPGAQTKCYDDNHSHDPNQFHLLPPFVYPDSNPTLQVYQK